MSSYKIPFNKPVIAGKELQYISESLTNQHISGDGPFTKRCQDFLKEIHQAERVLLTTSCTHALEMAALLLRIGPGDEVIVPSFTFVSTANAFVLRGARPVFVDIRPDTLNIDETDLERLITSRTKAVVVVHYAGVGCEMDDILAVCKRHNIPVVEDNAHGLFGKYKGKYLGSFGCVAANSFHETKNFTCGEGGALVINESGYVERAEIIREKGTNRSLFFRGQVDKYSWVDIGSSYLPSDILAAFLLAQLEEWERTQERRREIWEFYYRNLQDWAKRSDVRLPIVPPHCDQAYHMFHILMPSLSQRDALINHLRLHSILAVFHYLPLHLSRIGAEFGGKKGDCPVTEEVSDRILRLPFYNDLSADELEEIVESMISFEGTMPRSS